MSRPGRRVRPALRRLPVVLAAVAVALFAVPGTAQAHPTLLYTTPVADTAEATSPAGLVLVFNEPVTVATGGLVVLDAAGRSTPVEGVSAGRDGTAVTGRLPTPLPAGVYTVRWRVTAADGDPVESTFRFAVGAAITSADAPSSAGSGGGTSWPSAAWRWLLFAGLALALGGVVGARLSDSARAIRDSLPAVRGWEPVGAVAGLAAAAGLAVTLATDGGAGALVSTTPGRVALAEAAAFAAGLVVLRVSRGWAWMPLLVVPVAEGLRGHVQQAQPGWGFVLIAVHLAAAGIWVGALVHVVRWLGGRSGRRCGGSFPATPAGPAGCSPAW